MTIALAPERYVTIEVAATITGYSEKAIEHKIANGVWIEGREWRKAPDGRRLIDREGYQRWVESQSRGA